MTQPIQNGESGSSVRTKLNETIGKANTALQDAGAFATAAQGAVAATAVQPGDLKTVGGQSLIGSGDIPVGGGGGGTVGWTDVTDKPPEFPPEPHGHPIDDVSGLQSALDGKVTGVGITAIELITTAAHEALDPPNPQTLYVKSDAPPSLAVVDCGGDPSTPRPPLTGNSAVPSVLWINSPSEPAEIAATDLWLEGIGSGGGGTSPTFANVSPLSGDWRGTGAETLLAALTALQGQVAGISDIADGLEDVADLLEALG